MSPLILALIVFSLFGAGTYAVLARRARHGHFQARLMQAARPAPTVTGTADAEVRPIDAPDARPWEVRLRRALVRAGLRLRPSEFVLLCLVCPVGLAALAGWLTHTVLLALLLGLLGAGISPLILRTGEEKRRQRFEEQLTDTLTLLVSALRSGYSLARAAQVVAEEMPPPISEEFALALGEMALGLPLAAALTRMTERIGSRDLELIVTAVATQQQVGGNLAEILGRIADTIRKRVLVQGEIRTLTAEGKLSSLILILLPPTLALALSLRDPHYFQPLWDSPLGHALIVGALLGQIIGALLICRMVTLDV